MGRDGYLARQRKIWDARAARWAARPLLGWDSDPFLRLLQDEDAFGPDTRVLDIGCGAGLQAIALAPHVASVTGVDLSPRMVEEARHRAEAEGARNVSFAAGDFVSSALDGPYGLVYAHMTPAIADKESFSRMMALASGYCCLAKPCRRHSSLEDVLAPIHALGTHGADETMRHAFDMLWDRGCTPTVRHYLDAWETELTVAEALAFHCGDWPKEAVSEAARALADTSRDGVLHETVETEIVLMGWRMERPAA